MQFMDFKWGWLAALQFVSGCSAVCGWGWPDLKFYGAWVRLTIICLYRLCEEDQTALPCGADQDTHWQCTGPGALPGARGMV